MVWVKSGSILVNMMFRRNDKIYTVVVITNIVPNETVAYALSNYHSIAIRLNSVGCCETNRVNSLQGLVVYS